MSRVDRHIDFIREPVTLQEFRQVFAMHVRERYFELCVKRDIGDGKELSPARDRVDDMFQFYASLIGETPERVYYTATQVGVVPSDAMLQDMDMEYCPPQFRRKVPSSEQS